MSDAEQLRAEHDATSVNSNLGDSEITSVFLSNLKALRRYESSDLKESPEVEDLLQDTYLQALQSSRRQRLTSPKASLYKIAKNLPLNQADKAANRLNNSLADFNNLDVLANRISAEKQTDIDQRFGAYCRAVSLLPLQCRQVFVLKKIYGLANADIAKRLGIEVSTVDKHLAKGLLQCRNRMNATDSLPD